MEVLMRYITFALAKGRLAKKTLGILEKIGITCEEMKNVSPNQSIIAVKLLETVGRLAYKAGVSAAASS